MECARPAASVVTILAPAQDSKVLRPPPDADRPCDPLVTPLAKDGNSERDSHDDAHAYPAIQHPRDLPRTEPRQRPMPGCSSRGDRVSAGPDRSGPRNTRIGWRRRRRSADGKGDG